MTRPAVNVTPSIPLRAPHRQPSGGESPPPPRVPSLDGIRGIAILLVILVHTQIPRAPGNVVETLASRVLDASWVGVDLFFVLSGFLITGILLDGRRKPHYYRNFYVRRTLRIFPLYYAALLVFLALAFVVPGEQALRNYRENCVWFWLYAMNFGISLAGIYCSCLTHFWSLCIEEQFYLCWPAVVRVCRASLFPVVCVGLVLMSVAMRGVLHWQGWSALAVYVFTFARLDGLALGALTAYGVRRWSPRTHLGFALAGVAAGVAVLAIGCHDRRFSFDSPLANILGIAAISMAAAALVAVSTRRPAASRLNRVLSSRALRWFGTYSYSLYVFHVPVGAVCGRLIMPRLFALSESWWIPQAIFTVGVIAISSVVALVTWHGLEKHALALRDRLCVTSEKPTDAPSLRRAA
jgi:peptidoglycan/LPS O-acetylase OafA/YrhL